MKWFVKIPAPLWMNGIHRFSTRRAATKFRDQWLTIERRKRPTMQPLVERDLPPTTHPYQT